MNCTTPKPDVARCLTLNPPPALSFKNEESTAPNKSGYLDKLYKKHAVTYERTSVGSIGCAADVSQVECGTVEGRLLHWHPVLNFLIVKVVSHDRRNCRLRVSHNWHLTYVVSPWRILEIYGKDRTRFYKRTEKQPSTVTQYTYIVTNTCICDYIKTLRVDAIKRLEFFLNISSLQVRNAVVALASPNMLNPTYDKRP